MAIYFRILGIALSAAGTLLIAWRGRRIMKALEDVNVLYETNFRAIFNKLNGKSQEFPLTIGTNYFLDEIKPSSKLLLGLGFFFVVVGNMLVCASWYIGDL